ncbi:MAG: M16 family metallopeptidase [Alphaproteobacteria bacterium]
MSTNNITKLNNGLIILSDNMSNLESITLNILVKVGSRNEEKSLNGITHFLEHMAFKGTTTRTAQDIAEEFDSIGGYFNAYTSRESTIYSVKVLKEDIETAIDIIADIIQNSTFLQSELEKELNVILQEIAGSIDSPDDMIFDLWQEIAYPDQALGRSILGTEEVIKKFNTKTVRDYISKHYSYSNIIISAVGNLDHSKIVKIIEEKFSNLNNINNNYIEKASYVGGFKHITRDLEQSHLILGYKAFSYSSKYFYPMHIFSTALGGGMSSRLFQEIREKRGLAYSIGSFFSGYCDDGTFGVYVSAEDEKLNEIVDITRNQIFDMANNITQTEIERAFIQLKANILMSQESASAKAEEIARSMAFYGRIISTQEMIEELQNVTKEHIRSTIEKIISSKPTLTTIGNKNLEDSYSKLIA